MDKLVGFARKKRLGDLLVDAGVISQDQLVKALQVQKTEKQGERLGVVLIDLGFTDRKTDRRGTEGTAENTECRSVNPAHPGGNHPAFGRGSAAEV